MFGRCCNQTLNNTVRKKYTHSIVRMIGIKRDPIKVNFEYVSSIYFCRQETYLSGLSRRITNIIHIYI